MTFQADYPGSIVYPADLSNYYLPENHGGVPNRPRALVLHTPEEPWDNYESTPVYFSAPGREASTHYYADSDGDWYQLVPERCAAIANGLRNKPMPAWADPNTSLNWQTLSVEIEGEAATIHLKCLRGEAQWNAIVRWIVNRSRYWVLPIDRAHVVGHYQLADNRSDPGKLDIDAIVRDAQTLAGQEDDNMSFIAWATEAHPPAGRPFRSYTLFVGPDGLTKRLVPNAQEHNALAAAGETLRQMPLSDLKAYAGDPQPDS